MSTAGSGRGARWSSAHGGVGPPATMSATSLPAPGPMPKPWPENPVAMKKPGRLSTDEITGIASGITSIMPPQVSATTAWWNTGKA